MPPGRTPVLSLPIETTRLVMREFAEDDLDGMLAYTTDERVTRYLPWTPRDEETTRRHLASLLRSQRDRRRRAWELAVVRATDGRLLGACDLTLMGAREAEVGYVLARAHWGQGYATEVASALVDAAFRQLGVDRVSSTADTSNKRSLGVLDKCGMRWEGTVRRHARTGSRWWDVHVYSLSREDWQATGSG